MSRLAVVESEGLQPGGSAPLTLCMHMLISILAATLPTLAPPEQSTTQVGDTGAQIVAFIRKTESLGFTGAALAAKDGKVIAATAVGFADLDNKSPNTPSTLFEIASASKQFTAAAILRLTQDGKLSLDDPISKHLPGVPEDCSKITVRHLLQNTSGIPGANSKGGGTDLAKVLPTFLAGGPRHPPGTHFEYWNQGYALLSEIIARASRKPYTAYSFDSLFAPAGMTLTRFTGDKPPERDVTNVAIGRSAMGLGPPRSALAHPYGEDGFQYRGMGGVVTNVWDLWRWDRALHNTTAAAIFNAKSLDQLFKPGLSDYALGWFVKHDQHGRLIQSHGGSVRGFTCEVRRLPEVNGCIFILANRDDAPVRQVADGVQALLLGKPYTPINAPDPLPADLLKSIVGSFKDAKGNILEIKADGPAARAGISWSANASWRTRAFVGLGPDKSPVFFEWTESTPITLKRDDDGTVTSITMHNHTYERIKPEAPAP